VERSLTSPVLVRVYRNLNNGKMSLQCASSGHVLGHCDTLFLADARFWVREGGRQRVLITRRKNVHAFVIGQLQWMEGFVGFRGRTIVLPKYVGSADLGVCERVTYNPYLMSTFKRLNGEPVHRAKGCLISVEQGVWACGI